MTEEAVVSVFEDFAEFRAQYLNGLSISPWQERVIELLMAEDAEYLIVNCPPTHGPRSL